MSWLRSSGVSPLVIGHRGAPGLRPEHTRDSYLAAIAGGVDMVEPDLVCTRDGVLVVRHENEIGGTTDVAAHPEFAGRRRVEKVDGIVLDGWFIEDFTLAELKTLRAVERIPGLRPANAAWDRAQDVMTLDELLLLVAEESVRTGRAIGVCAELKHSTHFAGVGLPLEQRLLDTLGDHGLDHRGSGVIVESFETAGLRSLRERTDLPLVQLVEDVGAPPDCEATGDPTTYADLVSRGGLRMVSRYADAISVRTELVLPRDPATGALLPHAGTAPLVETADLEGLGVLAFTVRDENAFLPTDFRSAGGPAAVGDGAGWAQALYAAGVDGIFCDLPATGLTARAAHRTALQHAGR